MKLAESIRISWRAITGHKLRSALTTLGIVLGIASVIVFMVLGSGFLADALSDIESEQDPMLRVQTQQSAGTGFGWQIDTSPIYTESDIEALESIDGVEYVSPDGFLSATQLTYQNESQTGGFITRVAVPERLEDDDMELEGDAFASGNETVISTEAAEGFETDIEVGDEVTIGFQDGSRTILTVSGIVDDGDTGFTGRPIVYLPIEPHYTIEVETPDGSTERGYPFLTIRPESMDDRSEVQDRARDYLRSESDAQQLKSEEGEIRVLTREEEIERFETLIDDITLFVVGIAAIALVVGSIGIANIMIVSVTERTREIGIMKAVGARKRDIMQLFLVESLLLGAVGATLGLILGLAGGYLAVQYFGWQMAYPVDWILGATAVGMLVGLLAGVYPAWRAARVDPIEALRQE